MNQIRKLYSLFGGVALVLTSLAVVNTPIKGVGLAPVIAQETDDDGAELERQWTNQNYDRIVRSVGYPDTSNALVKKQLRLVYELTDRGADTYTYHRISRNGELRGICESIGYPTAYSTQFSRPKEVDHDRSYWIILPQPEPDGTYKPGAHSATYYLCKGNSGVYLEYAEEFIHASSQKKVTIADDSILNEGPPLLTYEELQLMKTLQGAELTEFLSVIADRLESNLGNQ